MIMERGRSGSGTGGGSVSIENGLLGIPSIRSLKYAVNLGRAMRSCGVTPPPNWFASVSASDAPTSNTKRLPTFPNTASAVASFICAQVLICDDKAKTELPRLAQNGGEGFGTEILELIYIEEKVAALRFRNVRPTHGRQLNAAYQEGAEEIGSVFADFPFAQVDDQDASLVHDFAEIETRAGLPDNRPEDRLTEELPDLVLDRGQASAWYCGFQPANSRSQNIFTTGSVSLPVIIFR